MRVQPFPPGKPGGRCCGTGSGKGGARPGTATACGGATSELVEDGAGKDRDDGAALGTASVALSALGSGGAIGGPTGGVAFLSCTSGEGAFVGNSRCAASATT